MISNVGIFCIFPCLGPGVFARSNSVDVYDPQSLVLKGLGGYGKVKTSNSPKGDHKRLHHVEVVNNQVRGIYVENALYCLILFSTSKPWLFLFFVQL